MTKTKAWISAMRLRTLPLSFSVILMGSALGVLGQDSSLLGGLFQNRNWKIIVLTLVTTLFLQILSNFANDYGDSKKGADNAQRIGPERAVQSGILSSKEMLMGIIVTSALSLISGVLLLLVSFGNELDFNFLAFLILGILAIAAAIKYTVGKGAYGYSGLGDVFVFLFFGILGVSGSFYLHAHHFDWIILLPSTTMGCFSVAVLNLNNMRDQVNDAAVGKNTLAVKLGFYKSKLYHVMLFVVAYFIFPIPLMISTISEPVVYFFIFPTLIIHFLHIKKVLQIKEPKEFDPELKKVALSTFLFALLFFVTVLIQF